MLMFPAKIKPEGRVIVRSRDFHGRYIARMLLFEKPIKHFQKQGFGSMYGIGEFRISPQHSVQIDFLCDHVVAAIQLSRCAQPQIQAQNSNDRVTAKGFSRTRLPTILGYNTFTVIKCSPMTVTKMIRIPALSTTPTPPASGGSRARNTPR